MEMLKIGIADMHERKEQVMRMFRGEAPREPNAPKLWFPTVESFMETISAGHRELLRHIVESHVPTSLDELARMTERDESDFAGMLKRLAEMGLVEMHLRDGSRLRSKVVDGRVAFVSARNKQACKPSSEVGRPKYGHDEPQSPKRRVAAR